MIFPITPISTATIIIAVLANLPCSSQLNIPAANIMNRGLNPATAQYYHAPIQPIPTINYNNAGANYDPTLPIGNVTIADVQVVDVEFQNRELQLDFVNCMLMFNNMSTLDFTKFMNRSFRVSDEDTIRQAFGLEVYSVPVINLGGKNWYGSRPKKDNLNRRARWLHTVQLIPQINVRIFLNDEKFNDFSLPVRTPSYMQGGAWFFTHSALWRRPLHNYFQWRNAGLEDRRDLMDNHNPMSLDEPEGAAYDLYQAAQTGAFAEEPTQSNTGWYMRWRNWHFSDGQDGWDQDSVSIEQYEADAAKLYHQFDRETGEFNTYNGDFGINVVGEIAIGFVRENIRRIEGWYLLKAKGKSLIETERVRRHNITLGWEYAYGFLGGMETMKEQFYSTNRLNINYNFIQLKNEREISPNINQNGREARRNHINNNVTHWYGLQKAKLNEKVRVLVETTYLMDKVYRIGNLYNPDTIAFNNVGRRLNIAITGHWRIRGTGNASFFAQAGYYGSDPYSVFFMTRRYFARFGIGWGFFISSEAVRDFE